MPLLAYNPDKIYLLIDNEYFEQDKFICEGTTIIKLSEYSKWCTNSFPKIHKASGSIAALKEYQKRSYHRGFAVDADCKCPNGPCYHNEVFNVG